MNDETKQSLLLLIVGILCLIISILWMVLSKSSVGFFLIPASLGGYIISTAVKQLKRNRKGKK